MGVFALTLKQTQVGKELYLYPNANGCNIDFTAVGEANNWQCTDDIRLAPDEDTTYVYHDTPSTNYDLYELQNHAAETGTINFIQVISRAKSHEIPQEASGIYKIIITEDACSNIYKSDDINLTIAYSTYGEIWATNPRTATTWTWADVDNLQIGIECSSPTITYPAKTWTVRPNAVGDKEEQHVLEAGCVDNYQCVDEETPDWFTTCLFASLNFPYTRDATDLYHIPNHTTENGVISNVKIFAWVTTTYHSVNQWAKTAIKTGGVEFLGDTEYLTIDTWKLISTSYANNPDTSVAWTWADIDALQIGDRLRAETGTVHCTQVYAIVNYIPSAGNPEIRTTQEYAIVNYNEDVQYTLNKPEQISVDHTQNIKMLNFWSGNRAVYGLTRSKRSMVLTGSQFGADADTKIDCVREMGEAGDVIELSGLGSTQFDKDFRIISFGWKKISTKPLKYDWILELEYA